MNLRSPLDYLTVFKTATRGWWDLITPLTLLGLSTLGVVFIYSAVLQSPLHHNDWIKQLVFLSAGALLYVTVSLIDYRFWLSVAHWFYLACLLPLVLVLIPGIGTEVYGSTRWIDLGFFSYQPSETIKVAVLLMVARILIRSEIGTLRLSLGVLGKLALAVGVPLLLLLLQPDLKSAIEGDDAEAISSKTQALAQASMKLGEAMYAAQQGGGEAQAETSGGDDVVDAEFEEVSDDDQKKSA